MLKTFASLGLLAFALSFTAQATAQAIPTATATGSFQAGLGYSIAHPDYGPDNIQGVTLFADYDFGLHFGVEADAHVIELETPTDFAENTYLAGPRFILPYRRIKVYAKGLAGAGNFRVLETQDNQGRFNGTYLTYAFGGGVDIDVTRRIVIRAIDMEYQRWPTYDNSGGLTPIVFTFGAAYHFH